LDHFPRFTTKEEKRRAKIPIEFEGIDRLIDSAPISKKLRNDLRTAIEQVIYNITRRRRILNLVKDVLLQIELDIKYLIFDLHVTRKERDDLHAELYGYNPNEHKIENIVDTSYTPLSSKDCGSEEVVSSDLERLGNLIDSLPKSSHKDFESVYLYAVSIDRQQEKAIAQVNDETSHRRTQMKSLMFEITKVRNEIDRTRNVSNGEIGGYDGEDNWYTPYDQRY